MLGWDVAGTVVAVGPEARAFKPGDAVFYAGAITRPGANAEFHLVDERIVGRKPAKLDWIEAAALPLTAITAWEMLFDRLAIRKPVPGAPNLLLIVGGAGGVGSMAIQLARTADRRDGDRHRLAARDARLGARARRPPRRRPFQAARGAKSRRSGSARRRSSSRPPTPTSISPRSSS